MQCKYFTQKHYFLVIWILFFAFTTSSARDPQGQTITRVLLVGDSWTEFFWVNRSLRDTFQAQGHPDILEKGDATTVSGSTAAEWKEPAMLQLIADELAANPNIDLVQLTIGGNDFLDGLSGNGWYVGISLEDEEALFQRILADVQTVIDFILGLGPQYEILLSFYDYTNFEESLSRILSFSCSGFYNDLNMPTTSQINAAFADMNMRLGSLTDSSPRVFLVDHTGLMQFTFGFPDRNIPPQTLLPPGDQTLPSPIDAMFLGADCIHLSTAGYRAVADNLWRHFYQDRFCVSQITLSEAWPSWLLSQSISDLALLVNRRCAP